MTQRHRVYFDPEDLYREAWELGAPIEFDNQANEAIVVVEGVEHRARLAVAS